MVSSQPLAPCFLNRQSTHQVQLLLASKHLQQGDYVVVAQHLENPHLAECRLPHLSNENGSAEWLVS